MGKVGKEIIQSRIWMTDAPKPPDANYKDIYPITVFEAVKETMEENSRNLQEILSKMEEDLKTKQRILPSKPSNYLVTYAGHPGAVGSIAITTKMSWDPTKHSHKKIPTEKAVGDLLVRFGLIDEHGNVNPEHGRRVNWGDIIGRPNVYQSLGDNDDGFMTQKAVTDAQALLKEELIHQIENDRLRIKINEDRIQDHLTDYNNPHGVTVEQIGAVTEESFKFHVENYNNPHLVTKEQIGLSEVNNTSDMNKPISTAVQEKLTEINKQLTTIHGGIANSVVDATYDLASGRLTLTLQNGSTIVLNLPINGLVDEVTYDIGAKQLVVTELSGLVRRVDISDLYNHYIGATTKNIVTELIDDPSERRTIISSTIKGYSITEAEIANNAINERVIADQSITSSKLMDGSITSDKLAEDAVASNKIVSKAILSKHLMDRSVNGRTLFSSPVKNRLLAVLNEDADPVWVQANAEMLGDYSVTTRAILTGAVTGEKIATKTITTNNIAFNAITYKEIARDTIQGENIAQNTIQGDRLIEGIELPGTPFVEVPPDVTSDGPEIVTAGWVSEFLGRYKIINKHLSDRIVNGRTLFTSDIGNKVLIVNEKNTDPIWGVINSRMIGTNAVNTDHIIDQSIISDKIAEQAIQAKHIRNYTILTDHIQESAVTADKIFTSSQENMVLAALHADGHPQYSKVRREMMENSVIGSDQIEDRSITLQKLETSDRSNRLLGVVMRGTDPKWIQATNEMIADHAINGRTLFRSHIDDSVLGVKDSKLDPVYLKITTNMIEERTIEGRNIATATIESRHLKNESITNSKIETRTIEGEKIKGRTITGAEMFSSLTPSRVLAVSTVPLSDPDWMQVTTDMIEDKAVSREKLFRSAYYHRVLAASAPNVPPEYIKLTADYLVDYSITPEKLEYNFRLYGTPEITKAPDINADNMQIPNTEWVRKVIDQKLQTYSFGGGNASIGTESLKNRAVNGSKLFTSENGYEVLAVHAANTNPVYSKIVTRMLEDRSITSNKLEEGIFLPTGASLTTRPPKDASDAKSNGTLIPDCQWVIDAIAMYGGGGGGGTNTLTLRFSEKHFKFVGGKLSLNWEQLREDDANIKKLFNPSLPTVTPPPLSGTDIVIVAASTLFDSDSFIFDTNKVICLNFYELFGDLADIAKLFGKTIPSEHIGVQGDPVVGVGNSVKFSGNHFVKTITDTIELNIDYLRATTQQVLDLINGTYVAQPDPTVPPITFIAQSSGSGGGITPPTPPSGGGGGPLTSRSVNGSHLFSSRVSNRALVVHDAETNPVWDQITTPMLEDELITTSKIAPAAVTLEKIRGGHEYYTVMATTGADYTPTWIKVMGDMIEDGAITAEKIEDNSIDQTKIRNKSISYIKLKDEALIDHDKLFDRSVSGLKIQLSTIENENIRDRTIEGRKLIDDILLGGRPTVNPDNKDTYKRRSLRNTIISMDAPEGGQDGDIWIRYI